MLVVQRVEDAYRARGRVVAGNGAAFCEHREDVLHVTLCGNHFLIIFLSVYFLLLVEDLLFSLMRVRFAPRCVRAW